MSAAESYRLITKFEKLFEGKRYRHRSPLKGNEFAVELYEDLYTLRRSPKLVDRIESGQCAIHILGKLTGITARRADGTFGERNPSTKAIFQPGYGVARSHLATVEIGIEVKMLAKAMSKQVWNRISDLKHSLQEFKRGGNHPITVAIVGVNHAKQYTGYEGDRAYPTDGSADYRHPIQEAAKAKADIINEIQGLYDELLILEFDVSNVEPYPFKWVDEDKAFREYGAALARISRRYQERF